MGHRVDGPGARGDVAAFVLANRAARNLPTGFSGAVSLVPAGARGWVTRLWNAARIEADHPIFERAAGIRALYSHVLRPMVISCFTELGHGHGRLSNGMCGRKMLNHE